MENKAIKEIEEVITENEKVLYDKHNVLINYKTYMESMASKKKNLISGENGRDDIEYKIKELNKKKFRTNAQDKELYQEQVEKYEREFETNQSAIKSVQAELNEISNKILDISKEIFGISTEIIMKIIEINQYEINEGLVSQYMEQDDMRYLEVAINRLTRICKLDGDEVERVEQINFTNVSMNNFNRLKKFFEIQKETLEIVCSPTIEVIPEYERKIEEE